MNFWESKKIRLRAFEEKDMFREIYNRTSPDSVGELYEDYIKLPYSEKEVRERLEKDFLTILDNDKKYFVIENLDEEYVGRVTVWHTDRKNGVFRYGILIDKNNRGKGYGKDALIIVLDYYFNELNYQKASPTVYSFNKNSQAFHEKFGFIKEGQLRNDIYSRGSYHDMIYYGMLKEEFNNLHKHNFVY